MRTLLAFASVVLVLSSVGCPSKPKPAAQPAGDSAVVTPDTAASQPDAAQPPAGTEPAAQVTAPASGALPKFWDFSAEWCPPCREQKPIVHELEKEYAGKVEFRIIDVDQEKELAGKYGVKAIPTQVFIDKDGNTLSEHVGLFPKDSIVARFKTHGFIQ